MLMMQNQSQRLTDHLETTSHEGKMNIPQTVASVCLEVYGSYLENDCKSSSYTDLETGQ